MKIKLIKELVTTKLKNYLVPQRFKESPKEEVECLFLERVIETTESKMVSPAFLILKKMEM